MNVIRKGVAALVVMLALGSATDGGAMANTPTRSEPASSASSARKVGAPTIATPGEVQRSLAPLVERVRPTVVGVTATASMSQDAEELEDLWRRFFGDEMGPPPMPFEESPEEGVGSGVIIDPQGLVLTNNHVVEGADDVVVRTADDQEYEAEVLGSDADTDVAVLRLKGVKGPMPAAELGNSDALKVGDYVVAIGSPFGLELSVTSGIVSAKARIIGAGPFDDFLQTDAAINPGNSGGPLFDLEGRVVGINTAIIARGEGIGFAVPISIVKSILPQLLQGSEVVRGYLGVTVQDMSGDLATVLKTDVTHGALVAEVEEKAPGARAGLRPGDVITELQGAPVQGAAELSRRVAMMAPGTNVAVRFTREGKVQQVRVQLAERPGEEKEAEAVPQPSKEPQKEEQGVGLSLQAVPDELKRDLDIEGGALIVEIAPGSRASRAGLERGDIVIEADGEPVRVPQDFERVVQAHGTAPLGIRVMREDSALYVAIPAPKEAR